MDTKKKIMLVEDQRHVHQLVTGKLQEAGFDVISCYNGTDASAYLNSDTVDLIILDLMLPDTSGKEILRMLKESDLLRAIPVIVLTAKGRKSEINEMMNLGAIEYFVKPFNPNELTESVVRNISPREPGIEST